MATSKEWVSVRSVLRKSYNREVLHYFRDLPTDDPPETTRLAVRNSCLIRPNESQNLALIKMLNFRFQIQKVWDNPNIYSVPITHFHASVEFLPQVILNFREKLSDAKTENRYPIRAQVGFRLTEKNISKPEAKILADKIALKFAKPTPFKWQKGRTKISYRDKEKGYEFILAAYSETEAKQLIESVLDLQGHTPDWDLLTNSESGKNWNTTEYTTILGKQRAKPKRRPVGYVQFTHAELKIPGLIPDLVLVDAFGRYKDALVYAT